MAGLDSSNKVVVDRTDGQSWIKMNIATGKTPADANVKVDLAVVDADANVSTTASLMDGVLVFESKRTGIMAILNDDSTDAITAWAPEQSGIDHQFLTFLEVENNNNRYIYGSTYTTVSGHDSQANGLRFFQVGSTTKNAWEDGFTEFDGKPLIRYFTSFALNLNGDLLLGTNNNGAIYEIAKNTFGAASGQRKLKNIAPLVKQTDLRYDVNVQNQAIRHMLVVDGKYLLVGFWSDWRDPNNTLPNTGGLFYKDMTDPSSAWKNVGPSFSVTGIIADRTNPARAVIATTKGIMIFENGEIIEVVPGEKMITKDLIDDKDNHGNLAYKSSAKTGFSGTMLDSNLKSVAQDKDGKFYFATNNGVATLVIKSKDF